jgi:hypothetical protein
MMLRAPQREQSDPPSAPAVSGLTPTAGAPPVFGATGIG